MHGIQSDTFRFPVVLEYVPLGHFTGSIVPTGQYRPTGQGPDPSALPFGLALTPPTPLQKYPASHGPLGCQSPSPPQKNPEGQEIGTDDPTGQYEPAGHTPPHVPQLEPLQTCRASHRLAFASTDPHVQ